MIRAWFLLILLSACGSTGVPTFSGTLEPRATEGFAPSVATLNNPATPEQAQGSIPGGTPLALQHASEDCFFQIPFVPGTTGRADLMSAWGEPARKSNYGEDVEYWYFDLVGAPTAIFKEQVLDSLDIYLKGCTLDEIALRLGPPERVAITILVSDVDPSMFWTTQKFYFSSPGFSYFRECEKTEDCFTVHSGDIVDGREFYRADMTVADSTGFNMATYVYKWHGFDANMEQIENKIPDFRP